MLFIARNNYNYEIMFIEAFDIKEANTMLYGMCEEEALEDLENQGLQEDWEFYYMNEEEALEDLENQGLYYMNEEEARTNHIESTICALYEEWTLEMVEIMSEEKCEDITLSVLNESNEIWSGYYQCDINNVDQEIVGEYYSGLYDLYRVGDTSEVLFLRPHN